MDRTRWKSKGTSRRIFNPRVETKQKECFSLFFLNFTLNGVPIFLVNFTYLFFKIFIYVFILAAPGLSCGAWDLRCGNADSLVSACGLLVVACMWDLVP